MTVRRLGLITLAALTLGAIAAPAHAMIFVKIPGLGDDPVVQKSDGARWFLGGDFAFGERSEADAGVADRPHYGVLKFDISTIDPSSSDGYDDDGLVDAADFLVWRDSVVEVDIDIVVEMLSDEGKVEGQQHFRLVGCRVESWSISSDGNGSPTATLELSFEDVQVIR